MTRLAATVLLLLVGGFCTCLATLVTLATPGPAANSDVTTIGLTRVATGTTARFETGRPTADLPDSASGCRARCPRCTLVTHGNWRMVWNHMRGVAMSGMRRHAYIVGVIVACASTLAGPAVAEETQAAVPTAYVVGGTNQPEPMLTAAQLEDLTLMAELDGLSLAEAIRSFAWREPFSELVNEIRAAHPDTFAGSGVTPGPGGSPWVAFDATAPSSAVALLAGFAKPVTVFEGRGFNEAEVANRVMDVHYRLYRSADVAKIWTGYDPVTGAIEASVVPRDPLTSQTVARMTILASLTPELRQGLTLFVVDALGAGSDTIYGGGSLTSCTAGFAVIGGSERGLSTAGHCSNTQSYVGYGPLTFRAAHENTWGDVQCHISGTHESDDFYYDAGQLRDTAAVSFANPGTRVCRFGKTTGAKCDYVFRLNQCWQARCHLTSTELRQASGGDSGGPWYYGGTAYGIHSGFVGLPGDERDSFTPVTYLDEALNGLRVATT